MPEWTNSERTQVSHPTNAPPAHRALLNLAFLFSIFCYLQVFPFSAAEIQPIGAIFAVLYLCLKPQRIRPVFIVYLLGITAYAFVSLVIALTQNQPSLLVADFETYLAVLAPVVTCMALRGNLGLLAPGLFLGSLYTWFLVGTSQTFFPELQQALGIDRLFEMVIARYSATPLEAGGRGATLLASEPSYSAHTIFLFFVFIIYFFRRGRFSRISAGAALAAVLLMMLFNRSATVALIFTATAVCWTILSLLKGRFRAVAAALVSGVTLVGTVYAFVDWEQVRFVEVGSAFLDAAAEGNVDPISFANQFGSIRTISVDVGYGSLLAGNVLGNGLGSWSSQFLSSLDSSGIDAGSVTWFRDLGGELNVKPYAHAALLALDAGVIGVLLDVMLLYFVVGGLRGLRAAWRDPLAFTIVGVSLTSIFVHTPVSLPVYWLTLLAGLELTRTQDLSRRNTSTRVAPDAHAA